MSPSRTSSMEILPAGSPSTGEPAFLAVGKLRRPHGVHGEILMDVYTDYPERLVPGVQLYAGKQHQPLTLASCRWHQQALLMTFVGYSTPESVGEMRNQFLFVKTETVPALPEGEYYHHQLIGLRVLSDTGGDLGVVMEILETGANDVCVVRPLVGREVLLPLIDPVILRIDLENRELHVHLLPGLVDEDLSSAAGVNEA